ncbi:MAG: helix-turn-helix domain-containing protein [Vulcanimicrobiota bacterium]
MNKVVPLPRVQEEKLRAELRNLIDFAKGITHVDEKEIDRRIDEIIKKCEEYRDNSSLEELYTPEEVAEYLKIAEKTVKDFLRAGRIKGVKVGKEWRIKSSALKEYVESLDS